jgi:hypothetical protein
MGWMTRSRGCDDCPKTQSHGAAPEAITSCKRYKMRLTTGKTS